MPQSARTNLFLCAALTLAALGNLWRMQAGPQFVTQTWPVAFDLYKLFEYQLSYADLGFVRRGLLGTLYNFNPAAPAGPGVMAAAVWPYLLFLAVWAALLARMRDRRVALVLLLSPALFVQAGFDLGRFDQINHVIFALTVLVPHPGAVLVLPGAVLIHEAALVIVVPLALALHVRRWGATGWALAAGGLCLLACLCVFAFSAQLAPEVLQQQYPFANEHAVKILSRDLMANIQNTYARAVLYMSPADWAAMAAIAAYLLALAGAATRVIPLWIVLVCLSPIALSLVGVDFPRWFALAATNLAFALAALPHRRRLHAAWLGPLWAGVLLGPMGVWEPLEFLQWLFAQI